MNARLMREPEDMGGNEHEESSDCKAIGCTPVEQPESSEGGVMKFEEWKVELAKVAREKFGFTDNGIAHTDWNAFKPSFDDGMTPEEALKREL